MGLGRSKISLVPGARMRARPLDESRFILGQTHSIAFGLEGRLPAKSLLVDVSWLFLPNREA